MDEQEIEECKYNLNHSMIYRTILDCENCPIYNECNVVLHWIERNKLHWIEMNK